MSEALISQDELNKLSQAERSKIKTIRKQVTNDLLFIKYM